jgi:hypothetical protein
MRVGFVALINMEEDVLLVPFMVKRKAKQRSKKLE